MQADDNLPRRGFLRACVGSGLAATTLPGWSQRTFAETPEQQNPYLRLIPADKRLDPAWIRSLLERGEKQTYRSDASMEHIGLPVGGLFAGTVYLSGDGRLWLWNIFNHDPRGIAPRPFFYEGKKHKANDGLNFVFPAKPTSPLRQGFGIRAMGKEISLDRDGFQKVEFRGEYPRAIVSYDEAEIPVSVTLESFSPFIPLNVDDSSLPATVMSYTVKNRSTAELDVELFGRLQNPVCHKTKRSDAGTRHNRVVKDAGFIAVECSATPNSQASVGMWIEQQADFGTMTLALLGQQGTPAASAKHPTSEAEAKGDLAAELEAEVARATRLKPGRRKSLRSSSRGTFQTIATWRWAMISSDTITPRGSIHRPM